jgi:hypothetical protein
MIAASVLAAGCGFSLVSGVTAAVEWPVNRFSYRDNSCIVANRK